LYGLYFHVYHGLYRGLGILAFVSINNYNLSDQGIIYDFLGFHINVDFYLSV